MNTMRRRTVFAPLLSVLILPTLTSAQARAGSSYRAPGFSLWVTGTTRPTPVR